MVHRYYSAPPLRARRLLAAGLAAAPAQAAEPKSWYVGASTDSTHVEVWRGFGWEVGGEERGLSVRGGWQFSEHFALEFAGLRAGDLFWTRVPHRLPRGITAHTTFDVTALQVSAVGKRALGPDLRGLRQSRPRAIQSRRPASARRLFTPTPCDARRERERLGLSARRRARHQTLAELARANRVPVLRASIETFCTRAATRRSTRSRSASTTSSRAARPRRIPCADPPRH